MGSLELGVNASGYEDFCTIAQPEPERVERMVAVQFSGALYCIQHMANAMSEGGSITTIGSLTATLLEQLDPTKLGAVDSVLRELIDRQEIAAVLHRYASSLDDRDWGRLRTCFAPDAKGDYDPNAPVFEGYDAIEALCRTMLEPLDASHHFIGNQEIVIEGDAAKSRCYVRAQHIKRGCEGGHLYEVAGYYRDELTRCDDGWRIHKRQLVVTWRDGNPRVVRPERTT